MSDQNAPSAIATAITAVAVPATPPRATEALAPPGRHERPCRAVGAVPHAANSSNPDATIADDPLPQTLTVLMVDDDPSVHAVTRLVLDDFVYAGRAMTMVSAHSAEQARRLLRANADVAVILVDVVLETNTAGLDLVRWIRETLGNQDTRIVLRTGQPDQAPEQDVILRYDINDYRAKTEMTEARLLTTLVGALRSFERIRALARHRDHLAELNRTLEQRVEQRTQALHESERRLRSILDAPMLPIVILGMADGRVLFANESANQVLGLFESHRDDTIWCDAANRDGLFERLRRHGRAGDFEAQVKARCGRLYWALISAITMTFDDTPAALLAFSDISGRKAMEEELKRLATTDPLTGIGNRRNLMDQGERELRRARRYASPLSLLMLDIDHFKRVNDTYGHAVGDQALKAMVNVCLKLLREIDVLCRFGGEEFVAILPETRIDGAVLVAERLRQAVGGLALPLPEGGTVSFTISIGVTAPRAEDGGLGNVLERADAALYAAKRGGRDQVVTRV